MVLPTILHLVVGVLKETAILDSDFITNGNTSVATKPPVSAVLQCLRTLVSCPLRQNKLCETEWTKLLQSALASIIDFSKTSKFVTKLSKMRIKFSFLFL